MRLIADDRIIRIGGAFDGQAVKVTKDPFAIDYDIVLDENDQDPNLRQYYTDQILQIAPILIRTGNFFPELLDYINLPAQFRQQLKQGMQQNAEMQQKMAQQGLSMGGRGKPRSIEEVKADVAVKQGRAAEHMAKARAIAGGNERDDLRAIFDSALNDRKADQQDRKLSIEALSRMFEALREHNKPQAD